MAAIYGVCRFRGETDPWERRPTIAADARLDNRGELLQVLGLHAGATDDEVILAAYEAWGGRCPERLSGDFAFAIWDPHARTVFCARDPFAVRPFFYHWSNHVFSFASELGALLEHVRVPPRLNELKVADFLVPCLDDPGATFYEDVRRLPHGHELTVSADGIRERRFWLSEPVDPVRLPSDKAYGEAFLEVFREAVQSRLEHATAVGAMLSGGLDSSGVVCVARELLGENRALRTFSVEFPDLPECDERRYMRAVVDGGPAVEHRSIDGSRMSPLSEVEDLHRSADEPFYSPALAVPRSVYRAVREAGVTAVLDGHGGDQVVAPPILLAPEPSRLRRAVRRLRPRTFENATFISPALAERVALRARLKERASQPLPADAAGRHRYAILTDVAPEIRHVAAAREGIQPCYPLFDQRLARFCLGLPIEQKVWNGVSRIAQRNALAGRVPREVSTRRDKTGATAWLVRALLTTDRHVAEQVVASDALGEFIDVARLRAALAALFDDERRLRGGGWNLPGTWARVHPVWRALSLALWLDGRADTR